MKIKYGALIGLAMQGSVFGAGKATTFGETGFNPLSEQATFYPQPGYWYNDTDSQVEVMTEDPINASPVSTILKPHELIKMKPFLVNSVGPYKYAHTGHRIYGRTPEVSYGDMILNKDNLDNLGNEYVIVFKEDKNQYFGGLNVKIIAKKEFEEKYRQKLTTGKVLPESNTVPFYPKPGYWYNNTDVEVEVQVIDPMTGGKTLADFAYVSDILKPHELAKMRPFRILEHSDRSTGIIYRSTATKYGIVAKPVPSVIAGEEGVTYRPYTLQYLNLFKGNLDNFGSEYVIVFNDADLFFNSVEYEIIPEKEFREKYGQKLAAPQTSPKK